MRVPLENRSESNFAADDLLRAIPAAALAASAIALAWVERGSVVASDWLPYAALAAALLAVLLLFRGDVRRLTAFPLLATAGLAGFAVWTCLSLVWSPVPSLARDEGLLVSLYAIAFSLPAVTLITARQRVYGLIVLALGLGATAAAVGVALRFGDVPADAFRGGRLYFPITYVNAQGCVALLAFWPCVAVAARRELGWPVRAAALGGATAGPAVWLLTQSVGAAAALGVSALVVAALAPARLRLALPAFLAAAVAAAAAPVLLDVYRLRDAADGAFDDAVRDAGAAVLLAAAAGVVVGAVYALLDRRVALGERAMRVIGRVSVGERAVRVIGRAAAMAAALAVVGGLAGAALAVDDPAGFVGDQWEAFKEDPAEEDPSLHFASFGSNRWDFWQLAAGAFAEHPVAGIGARGYGTLYREEGSIYETPERAHSLPLETLAETGVVGLVLLLAGLVGAGAVAVRARREPWGPAALGVLTLFLVHAAGDWVWSFPQVGIPVFALLGVAAAGAGPLAGARSVAAGAVVAAVALLAFVPPWLSIRLTDGALERGDPGRLELAQTLDPLSVEPLVAESLLAPTADAAITPLREAIELEPRTAQLHLLLAQALRRAGDEQAADAAFREARRLDRRIPLEPEQG